jgi:hypothetical protein
LQLIIIAKIRYIPTYIWSSIREKSCKIFWSFCQIETKIMKTFERRKVWLQWGQNQDANIFSSVYAQRAAACFEILVISSETRTKRSSQPPSFSWLVKQHECFTYLFLWLNPKSLYISRAVIYFYETEFEIWVGFGPADLLRVHEFLALFWVEFSLDKKRQRWCFKYRVLTFVSLIL